MDEKQVERVEVETLELEKKPGKNKQKRKLTMPKKKTVMLGAVGLLVLAVVISNLTRKPSLPSVAVTPVTRGSVEQTLDTCGLVSSLSEKTYFSPVSANVAQLPVAVGDNVSAGDLIVGYDLDSIQEQVQKANLELTAARSGYHDSLNKSNEKADEYSQAKHDAEKLYAEANDLRSKVAGLKDQLAQAQKEQAGQEAGNAANQQKIAELQKEAADLETTQAQLELQIAEKQRLIAEKQAELDALVNPPEPDPAASPAPIEDSSDKIEQLKQEISTLQGELDVLNKTQADNDQRQKQIADEIQQLQSAGGAAAAKVVQLQADLEKASTELSQKETELAKRESVRDSAQASILSNEMKTQLQANTNLSELAAMSTNELLQLARAGIKAEFSGIVTKVNTKEGAATAEGTELITVASNREVMVEISITKYDLEKIAVGQKAEITLAGHQYTGTVEKISRVAEANAQGTPVIHAQVRFDNPDDNIFLGVEAKVSVNTAKAENALLVPVEAINTDRQGSFVYAVENGLLIRKTIEIGVTSDDAAEIKSGLSEGDLVVLSAAAGLQEGMQVTPVQQ